MLYTCVKIARIVQKNNLLYKQNSHALFTIIHIDKNSDQIKQLDVWKLILKENQGQQNFYYLYFAILCSILLPCIL